MLSCPHCGGPGISLLRRAFLSPAIPATCSLCGGRVTVSAARNFASVIPFLAAIVVASHVPTLALSVLALFVGGVLMFYVNFRYVPLIKG